MSTTTYIDADDYSAADSPEQFAQENGFGDGDEFTLIRVEVISRSQYQVIAGKPVQVAIAFPMGGTTR